MRIKATIAYDGTNYYGYQAQKNKRTIQEEIENALEIINKKRIVSYASGRTDGHVHAKGQVLHFDTLIKMEKENWKRALNSLLPDDIRIVKIENVDDSFHARFSATKKEYRYYIKTGEYDVFLNNYTAYYKELNIDEMQKAIKHFIGEHDFTSFSRYVEKKSPIRTILDARIEKHDDILEIIFLGNGFLKYMVRVMVGALIDVGLNRKKEEDIKTILEAKNRKMAGKTASPNGLFLMKVFYEGE